MRESSQITEVSPAATMLSNLGLHPAGQQLLHCTLLLTSEQPIPPWCAGQYFTNVYKTFFPATQHTYHSNNICQRARRRPRNTLARVEVRFFDEEVGNKAYYQAKTMPIQASTKERAYVF